MEFIVKFIHNVKVVIKSKFFGIDEDDFESGYIVKFYDSHVKKYQLKTSNILRSLRTALLFLDSLDHEYIQSHPDKELLTSRETRRVAGTVLLLYDIIITVEKYPVEYEDDIRDFLNEMFPDFIGSIIISLALKVHYDNPLEGAFETLRTLLRDSITVTSLGDTALCELREKYTEDGKEHPELVCSHIKNFLFPRMKQIQHPYLKTKAIKSADIMEGYISHFDLKTKEFIELSLQPWGGDFASNARCFYENLSTI